MTLIYFISIEIISVEIYNFVKLSRFKDMRKSIEKTTVLERENNKKRVIYKFINANKHALFRLTVAQIREQKQKNTKKQFYYAIILAWVILTVVLIASGQMTIGQIPVFFEAIVVLILLSNKSIKKMLGEFERPKRTKLNLLLTWLIFLFLFAPLAVIALINLNSILTNLNISSFKWESLLVLTPGPALLTLVRSLILKKDSETNKKLLNSITKKIVLSSLCLILFFPLIFVVNNLGIDPALKPDFTGLINVGIGLYFWLAVLFFFSGIILILISIGDLFDLLERGK